jgi:peptidoglycan-N-acetylglucosamine deacetylase
VFDRPWRPRVDGAGPSRVSRAWEHPDPRAGRIGPGVPPATVKAGDSLNERDLTVRLPWRPLPRTRPVALSPSPLFRRVAKRIRQGAGGAAPGAAAAPVAAARTGYGVRPLPRTPREVRRLHHLMKVDPEARLVALTFDDGPFRRRTPQLLGVLAELEVPATFFMVGRRAEAHPGLVHQVAAAGHTIASHAYVHRDLVKEPTPRIEREIRAAKAALEQIAGREVPLFRPPHSSRDARVQAATHEAEQWLVHWTVSVNDGRRTSVEIADGVREGLSPNAIVLLHELPQTIEALPSIVAEARAAGYEFVGLPTGRPLERTDRMGTHVVRRVWSASRHHTAGRVLATHEQAHRVVLIGEDLGPAEAVAIAFAAAERALLIPSGAARVPAPMQAHLERLQPDAALVIGDEDVLGPVAVTQLHRWTPGSERLGHDDAFELATELAARLPPSPIVFVTAETDPCLLIAAASAAGRLRAPLLPLASDALRPIEMRWLAEYRPERVVVVGETGPRLQTELRATGATVTNVSGTPPAVADALCRLFPARRVWLAAPRYGSDLVVAAAAAAQEDAALLFADLASAASTAAVTRDLAPHTVTVVGGRAAVSDQLLAAILTPDATARPEATEGALSG